MTKKSPSSHPDHPSLPATMSVVEMEGHGGVEVLVDGVRPLPKPAAGEVLVKVAAAGVNGPDLVQRRGHYPPPAGASDLLGLEVSGKVVAVGSEVGAWQVGDEVVALTNGGGYAEYVAVNAGHCLPVPAGVGLVDGGGLAECYFTIWSNVWGNGVLPLAGEGARHKPAQSRQYKGDMAGQSRQDMAGWRMLVHGGSGGIGSAAIQLGAAFGQLGGGGGGEVFTTIGSEAAGEWCRQLGATRTINYREEDFVAVTREAGGADVVIDTIGGDYVARNIKAAKAGGRIIQLAFQHGSKVEIDLMPIMLKRLVYTGATLRSRSDGFKAEVAAGLREYVWGLFAGGGGDGEAAKVGDGAGEAAKAGGLVAVTYKRLPLVAEGAREAHQMLEAGGHRGKILLVQGE